MNILVVHSPDDEYRDTDSSIRDISPEEERDGFLVTFTDGSTLWIPDWRVVSFRTQAAGSETEDA